MLLSNIEKTINSIRSMKKARRFEPYIEEIAFPHFKNLERGLSITFDFPVTALIGQNGTNKSSILRALQSCPDQNSISDYWFETDLDHIENDPRDRQRYIHRYKVPSGNMAEVIKIKASKEERGVDYFETARPRISDGMRDMPKMIEADRDYRVKTRWRPIKKEVVYIDSRAQLPAFDILMSYQNRKSKRNVEERKSLVRLRSPRLDKVLRKSERSSVICGTERLLSEVVSLSPEELEDVGEILGRAYESIKLVKHDLYEYEGWTARLVSKGLDYTEAFAGSGEFAAILIVHELHKAKEGSLILLDEPETSLHPGAQTALGCFLLKMCKLNRFQIIMATHSGDMMRVLPNEGRKLLGVLPTRPHVSLLASSASVEGAFLRLGADYKRIVVYVEDALAAEFMKCALRDRGDDALSLVDVQIAPGGAQTIKTRLLPVFAECDASAVIVLDGDQKPNYDLNAPYSTIEECEDALGKIGVDSKFVLMNGGSGDNEEHKLSQLNKVLEWADDHVRYLPGLDPESLLLSMVDRSSDEMAGSSQDASDSKKIWRDRALKAYSKCSNEPITSEEILYYQKLQLSEVMRGELNDAARDAMLSLREIIDELLNDDDK